MKGFWFMSYQASSEYGSIPKDCVLEDRHPFEHLEVLRKYNDEIAVREIYTLLNFRSITKEEYDLAASLGILI